MPQLLSLSRAARLAGISRGELQAEIRQEAIPTFEGKIAVEDLLKPENKGRLIAILTYHVVPGQVTAAEVVKVDSAATVNGQPVAIKADGDTVRVNQATVVVADIAASNGVIHVIDEVILPPNS